MTTASKKVWFITGAGRGLGRVIAEAALEAGHQVAAAARDVKALAGFGGFAVACDVNDRASVFAAVDAAAAHFGALHVVVNNAGYGLFGPVEAVKEDELRAQLETNLFGVLRVCQAALPHLRKAGGGNILQLSSIAGVVGGAGAGPYHASKFALEGLSEALAFEVAPANVKVTLVEPGGFRTDFADSSSVRFSAGDTEATRGLAEVVKARLTKFSGTQAGDPKALARALLQVVELDDPPLHLLLGEDALARAKAKQEFTREETAQFEALSRTAPLPGGAGLSAAAFTRPWLSKKKG